MQVNSVNSQQPNFKGFIKFSNFKTRLCYHSVDGRGVKTALVKDLFLNTDEILSVQPTHYFKFETEPRGAFIRTMHGKQEDTGYVIPENNLFTDICKAIAKAGKEGFAQFEVKE